MPTSCPPYIATKFFHTVNFAPTLAYPIPTSCLPYIATFFYIVNFTYTLSYLIPPPFFTKVNFAPHTLACLISTLFLFTSSILYNLLPTLYRDFFCHHQFRITLCYESFLPQSILSHTLTYLMTFILIVNFVYTLISLISHSCLPYITLLPTLYHTPAYLIPHSCLPYTTLLPTLYRHFFFSSQFHLYSCLPYIYNLFLPSNLLV